jgi:HEAT repeat protein
LVCSVLSNVAEERQLQGAVPTLNRMLADPRTLALHEDLAETLGEIGDESSVPFLIGALSSKENWVRAKSAESLGKLSDTRAIAPLILLLKDDSESVIENAIDALADMRAIEGSGALTQVAASPEESTFLRSKAIQALAQMRSKEALPFLQRLVDSQENNEVVTAARQAIAALDSSA